MSSNCKRTRKKSPFCGLLNGFYNTTMLDDEVYLKESCKKNGAAESAEIEENPKKCFYEVLLYFEVSALSVQINLIIFLV